jgi:hypothetical protein
VPDVFPATRGDLERLNLDDCNTLLDYYGLVLPNAAEALVDERREAIRNHIGAPSTLRRD